MKIEEKDLVVIHDMAVMSMISLSTRSAYQNTYMAQTYAYTCATVMFLNGKKLLTEEVIVDDKINPKYIKD